MPQVYLIFPKIKTAAGVDTELDIIHDSVKGNLNPFPNFDCYTVSLNNGKHIIIVAVEEGFDPPYIHNDGRIYRRQESASDPIPESNRYSIDQLYNKSHGYMKRIENFRTIDYGSCQGEENWSYLYGYVNTRQQDKFLIDDFRQPNFHSRILDLFNKEINVYEEGIGQIKNNIVFNNITLFSDSLIIRNISNIDIAYNTLTIELFTNGSMKFMLPISSVKPSKELEEYCSNNNINASLIKFVHLETFYTLIMMVFIKYFKFLVEYKCTDDLELVFEGKNVWRHCLFSEEKEYLDYINKFSLPIVIKDDIKYPDKAFKIPVCFGNDDTETVGNGDTEPDRLKGSFIVNLLAINGVALSGFGMPPIEVWRLFQPKTEKENSCP
ncbi:hypothetical protein FACS1894200_11030 [Spirochaetia bacterium]|nr:hypothetical protein FACS1894200_11030 [Spirochaetia bacterium]